jgi:hypothetical protein
MMFLLDIAPEPTSAAGLAGLGAAAFFFFALAAIAFVAFKLLRKSVKMAFRMAVVAMILVIGIAGSVALWAIESKPSNRPAPRNHK